MLKILRQLFGTEKILKRQQQQRAMLQQQREMLLALGNSLQYSLTGIEKVKTSSIYQRCSKIVSQLSPMDVKNGKYVRVGRSNDGGYIMLDNFQKEKMDAAYSFGISNDVSWDEAIANYGIDVFMYDPSIDKLPKHHPNFHFSKMGIAGEEKRANFLTLGEIIVKNNHTHCKNMIMKMDVEGCEWDVLTEVASNAINQFSQFVIEFHDLSSAVYSQKYLSIVKILEKINKTHQSVHVHANNYSVPLWIGNLVLPASLEVTYVRRADLEGKFVANTRQFPTAIDQPNFEDWPDIYLGDFAGDESVSEK